MKLPKIVLDNFGDICRNELYRLFESIVEKYGDKYGFTTTDLIDEFLPEEYLPLRVVEKSKKNRKKDIINKKKQQLGRCIARTWNGGNGKRCSRKSLDGSDLCKTHINELNRNGTLKRGTIFGENMSKKYFNENKERKEQRKRKRELKKRNKDDSDVEMMYIDGEVYILDNNSNMISYYSDEEYVLEQ
tara:strand:- start:1877 stop:2440 length:564 start_codon:yes stop_codon:yes gene_type:complete